MNANASKQMALPATNQMILAEVLYHQNRAEISLAGNYVLYIVNLSSYLVVIPSKDSVS